MSTHGNLTLSRQAREQGMTPADLPWAPRAPGQFIKTDILDHFDLTQGALADRLGVQRRSVNELVVGKRAISVEMALRLSALTGQTAEYWLALQHNYDVWYAKRSFDWSAIVPLEADASEGD